MTRPRTPAAAMMTEIVMQRTSVTLTPTHASLNVLRTQSVQALTRSVMMPMTIVSSVETVTDLDVVQVSKFEPIKN